VAGGEGGRNPTHAWTLTLDEPGLWFGRTRAELRFETPGRPLAHPAVGDESEAAAGHSWVCVAPVCRVSGTVTLAKGRRVEFSGNGYHDHNFGRLPWTDMETWYWGRGIARCTDGVTRAFVFYHLLPPAGEPQTVGLITDGERIRFLPRDHEWANHHKGELRLPYGWKVETRFEFVSQDPARLDHKSAEFFIARFEQPLSFGPFYARWTAETWGAEPTGKGRDDWLWRTDSVPSLAEVFRPARLCGPIASRAMWTRIRRRS
jgi:hypothetical protein